MATVADRSANEPGNRLFLSIAIAMALVIVGGFSLQFFAGRSTFGARPLVHVHGIVFMGWVAIFVAQSWLATRGPIALHRRLGRIAALWLPLLLILGTWLTVDVVQRGSAPFFFQPQHFLIANPLSLLAFLALVIAALRLRRRSDWHIRLQISAMAALLGPGFGRLLPSPLLMPYAWDIAALSGLIFPAFGAIADWRRNGRVHPAWWWGMASTLVVVLLAHAIALSPLGDAIYGWTVAGHPGAAVPGLAFPPPPPMP